MMNQRTFEILGHWIAKKNKVKVTFETGTPPRVDLKNNHIYMPSDIPDEHVFNALVTLMHEAAHLRYTKSDLPKDLVKDSLAHEILNVIEDIRIDRKNMGMLWNVGDFYQRAVPYDVQKREPYLKDTPLHKKVLVNSIYKLEGLREGIIKDKDAEDLDNKKHITNTISNAVYAIDCRRWDEVRKYIEKIIKDLGISNFPRNPIQGVSMGIGAQQEQEGNCPACGGSGGKDEGKGKTPKGGNKAPGDGKESGSGGKDDGDGGKCPVCGGSGKANCDLSGIKAGYEEGGNGQGSGTGVGNSVIGEVALREMTKEKFKELLNIIETRRVEDSAKLNTDNLTAFFTGDVNDLFYDDVIERKKKSKILILVDASGSMSTNLLDGNQRKAVVGGCVKELAEVLQEVSDYEGLNVQWDIAAFTEEYQPLDKNTWEKDFRIMSGGTDLGKAFKKGQDSLLNDMEIDGNKLIVVFTDGEVSNNEIKDMKNRILSHGDDVRCMVIGVGAHITSSFVEEIVGDRNILAQEGADLILLETIMDMVE